VGAGSPYMMLVLGDVREVREEAEGTDGLDHLVVREPVQRRLEIAARHLVVVAVETDRGLTDMLDEIEHGLAFLRTDSVAENPPEQADIVAQRHVLCRDLGRVHAAHSEVSPRAGSGIGGHHRERK